MKRFKNDTDTLEKATNSDVVVHPINSDAAVVTGMAHEMGKDKSGKTFDRTFRWTDTFVNHNGKWECVASPGDASCAKVAGEFFYFVSACFSNM